MPDHKTVSTTPREVIPVRVQNLIAQTRSAADIEPQEVRWVWYPYIPAGALTILEGDPGVGKSTFIYSLAADLSQGRALPGDLPRPPMKVLILTREDTPEHTIVPRLRAHEANLSNVQINTASFVLDSDGLIFLRQSLLNSDFAVVFMDPLQSFSGKGTDLNQAGDTRAFSDPLAAIAQGSSCALVIVRHMRKASASDTNRKYRGLGSIDILGSSRSTLAIEDMGGPDRELIQVKENWGPKGQPLAFKIENQRVVWGGIALPKTISKEPRSVLLARKFILTTLAPGPMLSVEFLSTGAASGHSAKALYQAKNGIAETYKKDGVHWWALLTTDPEDKPVFDAGAMAAAIRARKGLQ